MADQRAITLGKVIDALRPRLPRTRRDPLVAMDGLVVRAGDTLIVRYDRTFSAGEAQQVKDKLGERLPGVDVLVIGCQQIAVYRPEARGG